MQNKKVYEPPTEELIFFRAADVVRTSAITTGQGVDPYLYDPYGDAWEESVV